MKRQWLFCFIIAFLCYLIHPSVVHAQDALPPPTVVDALSPRGVEDAAYLTQLERLQNDIPFAYVSPRPGAVLVSAATTIALRPGTALDPTSVAAVHFVVQGSISGHHAGEARLADDGRTVIFVPTTPFAPAERVTVTLQEGLRDVHGQSFPTVTFFFTISPLSPNNGDDGDDGDELSATGNSITQEHRTLPGKQGSGGLTANVDLATASAGPIIGKWPYYTLPADLPLITVTVAAGGAADGYLFLSNFTLGSNAKPSYLFIVNDQGDPIFYQKGAGTDFKQQPNGWLTYYSTAEQAFHALDASYQIVGTWRAGNGYTIDFHEFLLLPNGHALFMIYDEQKVNMDDIVPGGIHAARVIGLVIQELDTEQNVVFEWRSWDHIPIIDTIVPITTTPIDYVHGNAIEVDFDGNLLISSRHLNEITKVSRETGEIIWRFGGKHNDFTFLGDPDAPFALQHDIRRQPNGSVTLFDNRNGPPSRGVEYWLDDTNMTASLLWSYQSAPDAHAFIVGNVQRFANGNTLIGWGSSWPTVTEVNAENQKVFEMTLERPHMSYRIHRYAWRGWPTWPATLAITEEETTTLHYSWNGATDVYYYQLYGGTTDALFEIIDLQLRTGFEERTDITRFLDRYCYFQVRPMGRDGRVGVASNVVYAGETCDQIYLPSIMNENLLGD